MKLSSVAVVISFSLIPAVNALPDESSLEKPAITEIAKLGGKVIVKEHAPGKRKIEVHLSAIAQADEGLAHLRGLPNIETLNLYNSGVTDSGL